MKQEVKICLPMYKILYSIAFVVILSLIRGIARVGEIGPVMEPPIALLSLIFCSDTYFIEVQSNRREVFHLYCLKNKTKVVFRRLLVQLIYLMGISIIGYGLFHWQKPTVDVEGTSAEMAFLMFFIAILGTILFWGIFSMTISNLFQNIWVGIGGSILFWVTLNSQAADKLLRKWNLFSFTFHDLEKVNDWSWIYGKMVSLFCVIIMLTVIPFILKKRG